MAITLDALVGATSRRGRRRRWLGPKLNWRRIAALIANLLAWLLIFLAARALLPHH